MRECIFCGKNISTQLTLSFLFSRKPLDQPLLCTVCRDRFDAIDLNKACPGCSRKQNEQTLCFDCREWLKKEPKLTLNHQALFKYNEAAKEYMEQYKYHGDIVLNEVFTKEITQFLLKYKKTHHIVPIPSSIKSINRRGFNQVDLLLKKSGIDYEEWLIHRGTGQTQAKKSKKDRLLTEQFLAVNLEIKNSNRITNPILIVDDVYTTGRTILHAKKAFQIFAGKIDRLNDKKTAESFINIESFSVFR